MRGGYVAGAFFSLKKNFPSLWGQVTDFTASSASTGGIFYELSLGKNNPGEKLWTEDFADKKLINIANLIKGKKVYDIDYLVDVIFKKNNPCNISEISESNYGFYFPLINADTKRTTIFHNQKNFVSKKYDTKKISPELVYEYIRASTAIPILYDKTINIEGVNYIDAAIRIPYFLDCDIFKDHKKIVILSQRKISLFIKIYYKVIGIIFSYFGSLDKSFYLEIGQKYKKYKEFEDYLNSKGGQDTMFIYPSHKLPSILNNSKKALTKNYKIGTSDVLKKKNEIEEFLKN